MRGPAPAHRVPEGPEFWRRRRGPGRHQRQSSTQGVSQPCTRRRVTDQESGPGGDGDPAAPSAR
jgi:hypothetical protein